MDQGDAVGGERLAFVQEIVAHMNAPQTAKRISASLDAEQKMRDEVARENGPMPPVPPLGKFVVDGAKCFKAGCWFEAHYENSWTQRIATPALLTEGDSPLRQWNGAVIHTAALKGTHAGLPLRTMWVLLVPHEIGKDGKPHPVVAPFKIAFASQIDNPTKTTAAAAPVSTENKQ